MLLQGHYDSDIRVRRKAEALVAVGYRVDVLALRSETNPAREYEFNGVRVLTLSLGKKRGSLVRYLVEYGAFFVWSYFQLNRLMEEQEYAVVEANNLPDFLVFAARRAKRKGAKVVLDMHEITPEFFMSKYQVAGTHWLVRLTRRLERASVRFADHVITINDPLRDVLIGRGLNKERSTIVMNAVDAALFTAGLKAEGPRPGPAGEPPAFVMMYHGTLTRIYGLDIAIEAFAKVHESMPGAELWILGNGPEKKALEVLAKERGVGDKVRLLGSVLPQDVPRLLDRCDIGVLATRQDMFLDLSFSNKLSEYILLGKAVICSRLKTIRHYFSEDSLAFFKPHDPVELGGKMMLFFQDAALRQRMAEQAKRDYAPINWDVMKRRYLELMGNLVGMPTSRGTHGKENLPDARITQKSLS